MSNVRQVTERLRKKYPDFQRGYEGGSYAFEAAEILRDFREQAGLTQKKLADALGVSQARVAKAERGEGRYGPTYSYMKSVAKACNIEWPTRRGNVRNKREGRPAVKSGITHEVPTSGLTLREIESRVRKEETSVPIEASAIIKVMARVALEPAMLAAALSSIARAESKLRLEATKEGFYSWETKGQSRKLNVKLPLPINKGEISDIQLIRIRDWLDDRKSDTRRFYEEAHEVLALSDPKRQLILAQKVGL